MRPLGPVRQGTRTFNLNRRNLLFWPTTSTVIEVIPEKKLAFRVNTNNTVWSYELEPIPDGTRVIESRHAENGVKPVSNMAVNALHGRDPSFERELVDGMNASLAKIKAAAEKASWARSGFGDPARTSAALAGRARASGPRRARRRRRGRTSASRCPRGAGVSECAPQPYSNVDDMPVGRHLVAAHPEHRAQRPGQRQEEAAVAADPLGGLRHLRDGAVVAVVPALRGLGAAPGAHHLAPAQPDLGGGLVDLRVTGGHVAGHQPRVVRRGRQQVAGAQVARPDALIPGHPLRRQQRRRARAPAPPR